VFSALDERLARFGRQLPKSWRREAERIYARLLTLGIGELQDPEVKAEETEATTHLSVILPVHDAPDETNRCLGSLQGFAGKAEVIVVDDGSTDPRASKAVTAFCYRNGWTAVRNEKGSYHSGACMSGAGLATREVLCLLNSDTVVTQHSWAPCVRALLEIPSLMAVGPVISDGRWAQVDIRARRCRFNWSDAQIFWYAERLYARNAKQPTRPVHSFVGGTAFFVRRRDWNRVGGFDGCRAHIGNDVDLCRKLTSNGGWVGVCRNSYVHHLGSRSTILSS